MGSPHSSIIFKKCKLLLLGATIKLLVLRITAKSNPQPERRRQRLGAACSLSHLRWVVLRPPVDLGHRVPQLRLEGHRLLLAPPLGAPRRAGVEGPRRGGQPQQRRRRPHRGGGRGQQGQGQQGHDGGQALGSGIMGDTANWVGECILFCFFNACLVRGRTPDFSTVRFTQPRIMCTYVCHVFIQ